MELRRLKLFRFRNYEALDISFDSGVNLILGENAQGKTNLLEGICYLSAGHSYRTRREGELLQFGAEFGEMEATVFTQEREQELRAILFSDRRPRQLYLNGVKQKGFGCMQGLLTTVLFCPEDLQVLRAGAAQRRKQLDQALCQLRPGYDRALTEYNRLLEQKSRILKEWRESPGLTELLPDYNLRMAQVGAILIGYRANYMEKLDLCARKYHEDFSGQKEQLQLTYRTVSNIDDPKRPRKELEQLLLEHQQSHSRAELDSGQCLSGPHKDDFEAQINDLSVKSFGSQGQTRTATISLKLAEREIFRDDTGEEPILLLDDVLSELDEGRQDFVLNQIRTGQVFITCCEQDRFTSLGSVTKIEQGRIRRN